LALIFRMRAIFFTYLNMSTTKNKVAVKRSNDVPGTTLDLQEKDRKFFGFRFKGKAIPGVSLGYDCTHQVKEVVPDQSMSLAEILQRFTRGEAVPIGKEGSFDEHADTEESVDLEKIAKSDLVDREEYYAKLQETRDQYEKQEKAKSAKAAKLAKEKEEQARQAAIEIEVEKRLKDKSA